jgi:transposase
MRKIFDGLYGFVSSGMRLIPNSGEVFVFLNRSRTQIKLLYWEKEAFYSIISGWNKGLFLLQKAREMKCYGAT